MLFRHNRDVVACKHFKNSSVIGSSGEQKRKKGSMILVSEIANISFYAVNLYCSGFILDSLVLVAGMMLDSCLPADSFVWLTPVDVGSGTEK